MAQRIKKYIFRDKKLGVVRTVRDLPPLHFTLKIESYSSLSTTTTRNFECFKSGDFEVDGYQWKLCFNPASNGYISLHLEFSESNKGSSEAVNAIFKFLVYHHLKDKYVVVQEGSGVIRRFYGPKTKWGIDKVLPLSIFKDTSNGFLLNDGCIFGVDVFVIKPKLHKVQVLSTNNIFKNNPFTFTWKIPKFNSLSKEHYRSDGFKWGDNKWGLLIYPKGDVKNKVKWLSLFLELKDDAYLSAGRKVYVGFILRVKNQYEGKHLELTGNCEFSITHKVLGFSKFIALTDLNEPSNGYIKKDTLEVEVQLDVISKLKDLP